ncbi:hypothetical protein ACSV5T_10170, partial [Veillonella sp. ZSJB6]
EEGFEVIERHIGRDELYVADEIFLTGTAAEVTSVIEIDNISIGGGVQTVATNMLARYREAVTGQIPTHRDWITFVKAGVKE